ncbi:sal3, partial [Symbiodinium microadriaticum]
MVPLMESPHEDVRSFTIVAMPEMVRATAKALSPDREALTVLTEYVIGVVIKSVETEGTLELIMTGLQSLRQMFVYMCTNWEALRPFTTTEPPKPQPDSSIPFLSERHMRALTECATVVLRDSLQRRAVLRAEAQVAGNVDEDDAEDEEQFQLESMELHYNIAELMGTIFRTHGARFLGVYQEVWHEATCTLAHKNCLKEDRQFAYFVISDVIEFGLTADSAGSYFNEVMPLLLDGCSMEEPAPRQTCAYAMGMAAEKYPLEFRPFAMNALNALASSI